MLLYNVRSSIIFPSRVESRVSIIIRVDIDLALSIFTLSSRSVKYFPNCDERFHFGVVKL